MALEHILAAIAEEAKRERARLASEGERERAALLAEARARAAAVEAEAAASRDAAIAATAQRLASAAALEATLQLRRAREQAFQEAMKGLERRILGLRADSARYRRLFGALLDEALARVPEAEKLCVDARDQALAAELVRERGLALSIAPDLESAGGLALAAPFCRVDNTVEARLASAAPHLRRIALGGER